MSIHMITAGELRFVKEVLYDLKAIADPSEYLEEDVDEAFRILDSLEKYDSDLICDVVDQIQHIELQQQELQNE